MLLGLGGPESGDICYWIAEGYNYDHCDALSTVDGVGETSMNSIFVAAGPGVKAGYTTDRIIRQVDFAPTLSLIHIWECPFCRARSLKKATRWSKK